MHVHGIVTMSGCCSKEKIKSSLSVEIIAHIGLIWDAVILYLKGIPI